MSIFNKAKNSSEDPKTQASEETNYQEILTAIASGQQQMQQAITDMAQNNKRS